MGNRSDGRRDRRSKSGRQAQPVPTDAAPETETMTTGQTPRTRPAATSVPATAAPRPARTTRTTSSASRRPAARKAAPAATPASESDPRFENGPLAVVDVDGQAYAYCVGGLVLDVPAKSIPSLVDWTLREAKLGAPKLSGPGKDADPLLVLTEG